VPPSLALEALRNALHKCSIYLLYLLTYITYTTEGNMDDVN